MFVFFCDTSNTCRWNKEINPNSDLICLLLTCLILLSTVRWSLCRWCRPPSLDPCWWSFRGLVHLAPTRCTSYSSIGWRFSSNARVPHLGCRWCRQNFGALLWSRNVLATNISGWCVFYVFPGNWANEKIKFHQHKVRQWGAIQWSSQQKMRRFILLSGQPMSKPNSKMWIAWKKKREKTII